MVALVSQMLRRIKSWARTIKRDVHALYLAARDPRTPWYAKALALGIAAYALSPIDLIPDFIPVVGYLDEIILLPLAIMLAVRLVPADVMAEHRAAALRAEERPVSRAGAAVVAALWLLTAGLLAWWLWPGSAR
ncbi:YkvA family protein [Roseicella aquatilis]|nr:YkvA family protein [Roseicella aquatilis]